MKRKFHPWTVVARNLRPVLAQLHAATPLAIGNEPDIESWVKKITLYELVEADSICQGAWLWRESLDLSALGRLMEAKEEAEEETRRQRLATQIGLRLMCALDLVQFGNAYQHRQIPWTGNPDTDTLLVLIPFWRDNALYWASVHGTRRLKFFDH